ncbi:protein MIZU-KUSSEI 1-like [Prosopis cineraria]|uniref:protein MIZU-KUSSEI 1-like n=1 Tax=Prosopis cineraria TaxID=364024 RepID=UPI00240EC5E8|nr:protein MIZU-KUSSEI 1-like [Prosopis cineraria]
MKENAREKIKRPLSRSASAIYTSTLGGIHAHKHTAMDMTTVGAAAAAATVDCHKQVRSWRLLHSLLQLLIPTCNCTFLEDDNDDDLIKPRTLPASTITGTIFGYRRGKVKFCIQLNPQSTNPVLLLELPVATNTLAKEMRGGTLRMALETATPGSYCNLLSTPLWRVHCNGKKMGYAVKRAPSNSDLEAFNVMRSVVVGAGTIKQNELMFLRAKFRRVRGSSNSESFHLIDPEGSAGQELSVFFFRSRTSWLLFFGI